MASRTWREEYYTFHISERAVDTNGHAAVSENGE